VLELLSVLVFHFLLVQERNSGQSFVKFDFILNLLNDLFLKRENILSFNLLYVTSPLRLLGGWILWVKTPLTALLSLYYLVIYTFLIVSLSIAAHCWLLLCLNAWSFQGSWLCWLGFDQSLGCLLGEEGGFVFVGVVVQEILGLRGDQVRVETVVWLRWGLDSLFEEFLVWGVFAKDALAVLLAAKVILRHLLESLVLKLRWDQSLSPELPLQVILLACNDSQLLSKLRIVEVSAQSS
jgi:hypothetical protein